MIIFRIVLLDVRNASELINPGKIPGSVHIPLYEISEAFQMPRELFQEKFSFEKPNQEDKNVVLTCRFHSDILKNILFLTSLSLQGLVGEYWWQIPCCKIWVTISFVFTMGASKTGKTTAEK